MYVHRFSGMQFPISAVSAAVYPLFHCSALRAVLAAETRALLPPAAKYSYKFQKEIGIYWDPKGKLETRKLEHLWDLGHL